MHVGSMTLAALALAAVTPALAGCSSGPPPLGAAPSGENQCIPAKPGQGVTYGLEAFTNHSSSTVVFDRVGLRQPRNLKLLGAYAIPGDRYPVGIWADWPPAPERGDRLPVPPSWAHRHPVSGYRLRPGASAGIVLGVESTARPGGQDARHADLVPHCQRQLRAPRRPGDHRRGRC